MPDVYGRYAKAGIERAAEPGSAILAYAGAGSVARTYNLIAELAARADDLEGLVLVHQDAEIRDPQFCAKLRRVLSDPDVAVVGCVGATGVRDTAWWDGEVTWNSASYFCAEVAHGELPWRPAGDQPRWPDREVDTVYGVMLALSPWAVKTLRFDEAVGPVHGYDFDICRQARSAGRKVVVADLQVAHHRSLDLVTDAEAWIASHMRAAEHWDPGVPRDEHLWRMRARRAEADAAAAQLLAASKLLQLDAWAKHNAQEIESIESSRSWRITEPLRRGNAIFRQARRPLVRKLWARRSPPPS
jgi:hypothetical protein